MKLRIMEILQEKGKTKYWLYIQLGLSYQNFNKIVKAQRRGFPRLSLSPLTCFAGALPRGEPLIEK